jgi:tRNA(Arg) A34 adenosine deaminase TadA
MSSRYTRYVITAYVYDRKGNLLSTGTNSYTKTHPMQKQYATRCGEPLKQYLHAEIAALVKARGEPYEIYIERTAKNGGTALAKPCPICEMAIKEAGIKVVRYTV